MFPFGTPGADFSKSRRHRPGPGQKRKPRSGEQGFPVSSVGPGKNQGKKNWRSGRYEGHARSPDAALRHATSRCVAPWRREASGRHWVGWPRQPPGHFRVNSGGPSPETSGKWVLRPCARSMSDSAIWRKARIPPGYTGVCQYQSAAIQVRRNQRASHALVPESIAVALSQPAVTREAYPSRIRPNTGHR